MEQKRVSFKVAQAIEEAGYPQWDTESADNSQLAYDCVGELWEIRYFDQNPQDYYSAPTYLDVWLWLCRENSAKITLEVWRGITISGWGSSIEGESFYKEFHGFADPEEAIIAAIEYLVDNGLIK